jgi:MFS family permease
MLQSFALAALTLSGRITIAWIVALLVVQGLVNAFDMPGRQAFVVQLVDKPDLPNAIALNSSMFNGARLVGPSIAGGIIAGFGEGWIFLVDGFSYFAVMLALIAMRTERSAPPATAVTSVWRQVREGLSYIRQSTPLRSIMTLLALVSLVGFPYTVLMPVFATEVLGGGPSTLGMLMASIGCGALTGALWLAARRSILGLGRIIPMAAGLFGATLIAFSFSRILWISMILLVFSGIGFIVQMASSNTVIQTIVEDSKRGRVMSFYVMAFLGTAPLGSLLAGTLAERIGAPRTLEVSGVCCLAAALWFARELPKIRAAVRPIYVRLGILPEVTSGLHTASNLMTPPED